MRLEAAATAALRFVVRLSFHPAGHPAARVATAVGVSGTMTKVGVGAMVATGSVVGRAGGGAVVQAARVKRRRRKTLTPALSQRARESPPPLGED